MPAGAPDTRPDGGPARTFYGRRRARPLRRGRAEALDRLLDPLSVDLPEDGGTLDPAALFAVPVSRVWLEIGFGGGEHVLWQLRHHGDVGILGCEPFLDGVAALLRDADAAGVTDRFRLYADDARPVLDALPAASIDRLFLLFPDPWPKTRHHRRRFIQPDTVAALARVAKPGAELRIGSDDAPLVDWMLRHVRAHGGWRWLVAGPADWRERPDDWPQTRYEAKRLHGPPVFLRFQRV